MSLDALKDVEDVLQVIQIIKDEPDAEYKYLFEQTKNFGKLVETIIEMPRIIKCYVRKL